MLALLLAPQVDAAAAEALRQQLQARHDGASKRHLQAMLDAGAVLTPEQRQTLAARLNARREMMERHRRERQAG
jgi:Spy/CpxP family protein refolding chaperone